MTSPSWLLKARRHTPRRHTELSQVAQTLGTKSQQFASQRRAFVTMQDEVKSMRATKAPEMLRQTQARYPGSGLTPNNGMISCSSTKATSIKRCRNISRGQIGNHQAQW